MTREKKKKKEGRSPFWSAFNGCIGVPLSVSVGTMALLRCWESQAPCWPGMLDLGVSRGTSDQIR